MTLSDRLTEIFGEVVAHDDPVWVSAKRAADIAGISETTARRELDKTCEKKRARVKASDGSLYLTTVYRVDVSRGVTD